MSPRRTLDVRAELSPSKVYSITAMLVLDPISDLESLKSSLFDLLRTKGWSKLAAQLQYNEVRTSH